MHDALAAGAQRFDPLPATLRVDAVSAPGAPFAQCPNVRWRVVRGRRHVRSRRLCSLARMPPAPGHRRHVASTVAGMFTTSVLGAGRTDPEVQATSPRTAASKPPRIAQTVTGRPEVRKAMRAVGRTHRGEKLGPARVRRGVAVLLEREVVVPSFAPWISPVRCLYPLQNVGAHAAVPKCRDENSRHLSRSRLRSLSAPGHAPREVC